MPMNAPSHLGGHMTHGGQPMPFAGGYRQGQPGPSHSPLQPSRGGGGPRGAPPRAPPHGYGASPKMGPALSSQQVRQGRLWVLIVFLSCFVFVRIRACVRVCVLSCVCFWWDGNAGGRHGGVYYCSLRATVVSRVPMLNLVALEALRPQPRGRCWSYRILDYRNMWPDEARTDCKNPLLVHGTLLKQKRL